MSEHPQDQAPDRPDLPTEDQAHTSTPQRRKPTRHGRITIERIETTPMTSEDQYRRAVQALATLYNEWRNRTTSDKKSPDPE
ncbi:hypothetical protein [Nocardia jiangxiensis]|uniref:hypothetical protein n=1 Tax=Nocardia jiangxiensis TaxID=282685 RepID=UPI0002D73F46|nr:hypothetical protein [Nocardia jiangxiensis]